MISGYDVATAAVDSNLIGTPYSKLDCQAFVEEVLKRLDLPHNFRGSNHMWRELVTDRGTVKGSDVPVGSLAFIVRDDGGEVKRGYHDDMGNATHVAIVMWNNQVMESTTGGVQYGKLSRFTNYGLIKGVTYEKGGNENAGEGRADKLLRLVDLMRKTLDEMEAVIHDLY